MIWQKYNEETLQGILKLLDSAEKLLDNGGNKAICGGLYTFAVEEYGKLLLLKRYIPYEGKVKIRYTGEFLKHAKKFEIALKLLPKECTTIHTGIFDEVIFDPEVFDVSQVADLEARMAVFYCDFTDSGDNIRPVPAVDVKLLKAAIIKLRGIVLETDIS
jgi:AbiV family abortive infection protein